MSNRKHEEPVPGLGRRIASLREQRGVTQEHLAAATGYSVTHLAQVETRVRLPSLRFLAALAVALEVEVADLFPRDLAEDDLCLNAEERAAVRILRGRK